MKEELSELRNELVEMIGEVAVAQTENHLEVLNLIKGQNVEIAVLRADVNQVKADVAMVKADVAMVQADVAQVKADVSSIKAKMSASDLAAERRHNDLLNAIRSLHGVPNAALVR